MKAEDGWRFEFQPNEGRPFTKLTINLEGEIPDGYVFEPLTVAAPFYEVAFVAYATPTTVDTSEAKVLDLFSTNPRPSTNPLRDLFKMYQETRAIAQTITRARPPGPGARIRVQDVQAVYKFLETAYVMTERTQVVLASDVIDGYQWLMEARNDHAKVVGMALDGFDEEASQILTDVSQLESIPYRRLWTEIGALPCSEKIRMIEEFYLSLIRPLGIVNCELPVPDSYAARGADLAERMVPPKWSYMETLWRPVWDTLNIATLGTVLALIVAVPIAFCAARNTTPDHYVLRPLALLVIVSSRSINSLIWALMLVAIIGPGVLAGVIAIGLRSIGFCAKLLYEAIEEIDEDQVEAITADGAPEMWNLVRAALTQAGVTSWLEAIDPTFRGSRSCTSFVEPVGFHCDVSSSPP